MAEDIYGTNKQEAYDNQANQSYNQEFQPAQAAEQPTQGQESQPTQVYSPAPEFGAYGPVNTTNNQPPSYQPAEGGNGSNFANQPGYASDNSQNQELQSRPGYGMFNNPYPASQDSNNSSFKNGTQNGTGNKERKTSSNKVPNFVVAILSSAVSAVVCVVVICFAITQGLITIPSSESLADIGKSSGSAKGTAIVKGGQAPDWKGVAQQVSGSVVSIQTQLAEGMGKGSGVIIDKDGHIVTNNHVISGAKQIQVTLANGQMCSATLVGADKTTDLAVLKLDNPPKNLKTSEFADSDSLAVGEPVMAIGNPLGYDDTATTGIVSALNRPVSVMDDKSRSEIVTNAIQIDAAINPGNSGGPTFNAAGKVIGINSSIAATSAKSGTAGSIGIGFAIPANLVKRVVSEIIKRGYVKHVALGITIKSVAVESGGVTRGGAQVVSVNNGAPASKAGMHSGDTIVAFNDKPVSSNYALLGFVRATALNDTAVVSVVRNGSIVKLKVKFDQEEASVIGNNKQDANQKPDSTPKKKPGSDGKSDDDDDDIPFSRGGGDDDGDDGGIVDPFGFW